MNRSAAMDWISSRAGRHPALAVFLVSALVFGVFNVLPVLREAGHIAEHGQVHTHVRLAAEMLQGRVEFHEAFYKDIADFHGRFYSPFPPFPAFFLMPLVALFGVNLPTMLLTPLLGALAGTALFRLLRALGIRTDVSAWATAGFLFGTAFWLVVRFPFDTYFAHVLATALVFLALEAAAAHRSGAWVGLAMGAAFLCRQLTVLALPFAWLLMLRPGEPLLSRRFLKAVLASVPALALALGIYLYYNWIRFGNPLDCGYAYIPEYSWYLSRLDKWGVQSLAYVPSNFVRLFLQGFVIEFNDPDLMIPDISRAGTSLTFASPFLFFAFRNRFRDRPLLDWTAWGGIGLCALAVMMNKNAMGGWQINGMRYALDFLPVLAVLAARGMQRDADTPWRRVWQGAIAYAIGLNLLATALYYLPKLLGA